MSSLSSRCVIPLRPWSPFPLSFSHLRFQAREKCRTSEPRPPSRPPEWPSLSSRCVIPFAPGVRSRCRPVTCASRCERRVAPRSPAPHPDPLSGHPVLPGARFPSHLESVPAVGQLLALPRPPGASLLHASPHIRTLRVAIPFSLVRDSLRTWSPFPLSASHLRFRERDKSRTAEPRPACWPSEWPSHSPWCAIPFAPGVRSRCRPVTCASRCERRVAPRSPTPRTGPLSGHPTLPGARFPSHLESVSTVVQSLALPGA